MILSVYITRAAYYIKYLRLLEDNGLSILNLGSSLVVNSRDIYGIAIFLL